MKKQIIIILIITCNSFLLLSKTKELNKRNDSPKYLSRVEVNGYLNEIYTNTKEIFPYYNKSLDSILIDKKDSIISSITDSISTLQLYYRLQEMMAYTNDYHTHVQGINRWSSGWLKGSDNIFPLILNFNNHKAYLKHDFFNNNIPMKSEVLSINNILIDDILSQSKKLCDYKNNPENTINNESNSWRNVTEFSNLLRYCNINYPYTIAYKEPKSKEIKKAILKSVTRNNLTDSASKYYNKKDVKKDQISLKEIDNETALLTINTFTRKIFILWLFKYPSISNAELNRTMRRIKRKHYKNLIIDLRHNEGGSMSNVYTLLDYLIDGDYYVNDNILNPAYFNNSSKFQRIDKEIKDYYNISMKDAKKYANKIYTMTDNLTSSDRIKFSEIVDNRKRKNSVKHPYKGNVYFLAGSNSLSATIMCLDIVKNNNIGLIIGDDTGGNIGVTTFAKNICKIPGMAVEIRSGHTLPLNKDDNIHQPIKPHLYKKDSIYNYTMQLINQKTTIKTISLQPHSTN